MKLNLIYFILYSIVLNLISYLFKINYKKIIKLYNMIIKTITVHVVKNISTYHTI
jgi:hypothetical protein